MCLGPRPHDRSQADEEGTDPQKAKVIDIPLVNTKIARRFQNGACAQPWGCSLERR